jgi:hypothetical protein
MSDKKEKHESSTLKSQEIDEIDSILERLYEEVEKDANASDTKEPASILTANALLEEPMELPHHNDLPPGQRGMYVRYDLQRCPGQHWGTKATINFALKLAQRWRDNKHQPVIHFGDISAKNFAETKCHDAHKMGTHLDVDLPGILPKDDGYDADKRKKCIALCWYAIYLGANRVLFGDSVVAHAVNKIAREIRLVGRVDVRDDHKDHFHIEL